MNNDARFRGEAPRDVNDIERQNEQIRSDMGEAIDALQRRFSPGQLLDRALNLTKEHGGEFASNLGSSVKQNPMPALLTAIGIAWMMGAQARGGGDGRAGRDDAQASDSDEPGLRERLDSGREALRGGKSRMRAAGERIGGTAAAAGARLRSSAASVRDSAHSTAERTRALAGSAREGGRRAKDTFDSALHEQPLVVAALGIALGALVGSLLPATEQEDRLLGPARDRTLDRARAAGERQYERARETAARAMEDGERAATQEHSRPH